MEYSEFLERIRVLTMGIVFIIRASFMNLAAFFDLTVVAGAFQKFVNESKCAMLSYSAVLKYR